VHLISEYVFPALLTPILILGQTADSPLVALDTSASAAAPVTSAPENALPGEHAANPLNREPPGGKRVFGVPPKYRTASSDVEGSPITAKQKMAMRPKDSFDYPLVIAAAFAGLDRASGATPIGWERGIWMSRSAT